VKALVASFADRSSLQTRTAFVSFFAKYNLRGDFGCFRRRRSRHKYRSDMVGVCIQLDDPSKVRSIWSPSY
jgi:hypothetical protein